MQVARNFFLNPEKTYTRKLKEILLAFNMERALTKDEILELYLNKIFLGHRAYGFAAAAQVYYGDDLLNLSVPEIAMLAGLPKAPSRDNPISNPERARERRTYVLKRLHELGRIDDLSFETARDAPITARRHIADVDIQAPYISEMARQLVFDRFGESVYQRGLNITVTINSIYQEKANQALRKGLIEYDKRHGFKGPISNIALDAFSGEDFESRLIEQLAQFPASKELVPAVITQLDERSFQGLNQRGATGTVKWENIVWAQRGATGTVEWENIVWARKYSSPNSLGPELTTVDEILTVGDVVYVRDLGEGKWMLSQLPEVSGALVSLDSSTGAILALTGGFDYYLSKFNRATQAERQPGSNIKPFIYSAALDNGFTASSLVSAAPIVVDDSLEGVWRPQNYSKKFFGPTPLRKALSLSLNLVSVRLLRAMGIDTTIDHLVNFGFDRERLPGNLSLALGSTSITPLELASRFAGLANGGYRVTPFLIEKIEDSDGNRIELPPMPCDNCGDEPNLSIDDATIPKVMESEEQGDEETVSAEASQSEEVAGEIESRRAISPQNAFLMQSLLKQVILTGTGRRALALNRTDLAGKTGTTNNFRDAWFSGFNPDVVTTVFVGFDEPSHLGKRESGASAALPIWVDFMGLVLQDFPEMPVKIPENITTRFINKDNGQVTAPDDPDGYSEYFAVGTEPNNLPVPITDPGNTSGETDDNQSVSETLF
jgi:penicillin-binding protein 1A